MCHKIELQGGTDAHVEIKPSYIPVYTTTVAVMTARGGLHSVVSPSVPAPACAGTQPSVAAVSPQQHRDRSGLIRLQTWGLQALEKQRCHFPSSAPQTSVSAAAPQTLLDWNVPLDAHESWALCCGIRLPCVVSAVQGGQCVCRALVIESRCPRNEGEGSALRTH